MTSIRRITMLFGLTTLVSCASGRGIELHNPSALPPTNGLYSHYALERGSRLVFVAGQVAVDSAGQLVGAGDMAAQARKAYANLAAALRESGASWNDVVKTTTYVTDAQQLAAIVAARKAVFGDVAPPNTLVQVVRLARAEWLFEVEAVAIRR